MRAERQHITDPVVLARAALAERCGKNPQYSLRAFARASGISHTVLSLVLSGKRKFSKKAVSRLVDFLEVDPVQAQKLQKQFKQETQEYQDLSLDTFQVISDWYHYAILSALELPKAKFEAKWIAKSLSISLTQAKLAMDRLQRLGLVEEKKGKFSQSGKAITVDNIQSTVATRTFHKQLLDKAKEAIETTSFEERDMSSTTFAMDETQIPYAKKRIREFRRQLSAELEAMGAPTAVYNLTVQIFPVTPTKIKQESQK
ncbi:MAG: TIGR02147 family protein [Bdellovibrionota bacterium]